MFSAAASIAGVAASIAYEQRENTHLEGAKQVFWLFYFEQMTIEEVQLHIDTTTRYRRRKGMQDALAYIREQNFHHGEVR